MLLRANVARLSDSLVDAVRVVQLHDIVLALLDEEKVGAEDRGNR